MVVGELKDQTVTYLVGLEAVEIEAQDPNIKNEDSSTSPSWKISCKDRVIFHIEMLVEDDED